MTQRCTQPFYSLVRLLKLLTGEFILTWIKSYCKCVTLGEAKLLSFRRLDKLADEPIWLFLQIDKSDQLVVNNMKLIMEKLEQLPVVHLSFRIVAGYSDEIVCSDEVIVMKEQMQILFSADCTDTTEILLLRSCFPSSANSSGPGQLVDSKLSGQIGRETKSSDHKIALVSLRTQSQKKI